MKISGRQKSGPPKIPPSQSPEPKYGTFPGEGDLAHEIKVKDPEMR